MTRRRNGKTTRQPGYQAQLRAAIRKYLPRKGLPLTSPDHRVRWTPRLLAMGALLMSWSRQPAMLDAFAEMRRCVVSMYKSRKRPGETAKGFFKALRQAGKPLVNQIKTHLQQQTIRTAASRWKTGRWVGLAVDGSRVECPRTPANEQAFGCGGRHKTAPQQWTTQLFHVVTGLLWDYRTGPGTDSERNHLWQMLGDLPTDVLLLMDAGFPGFDLLRSIIAAGHHFIVRVGANVTLLQGLDYDVKDQGSTVWLWPKGQRDRQPPLKLRKVEFICNGQKVCLLTSVLSSRQLSDEEVKQWYRRRWLIEVQYRSLKQTMQHRTLLSDSPAMARLELHWAILGLWLLELLLTGSRRWDRSRRYSVAQGLRAVRRAMHWTGRVPAGGVMGQLRRAVHDRYVRRRPKRARDWPHKKKDPPCGLPKIRGATAQERQQAQAFHAPKALR